MNLLVLTSEPITAQALRDAVAPEIDAGDVEVVIVAPALHDGPLQFWLSDSDAAIERARWIGRTTVDRLGEAGVPASADTGESEPFAAIEDALRTFDADRIVVFAHAQDASAERYREHVNTGELAARFGLPVDRAIVSPAELPSPG